AAGDGARHSAAEGEIAGCSSEATAERACPGGHPDVGAAAAVEILADTADDATDDRAGDDVQPEAVGIHEVNPILAPLNVRRTGVAVQERVAREKQSVSRIVEARVRAIEPDLRHKRNAAKDWLELVLALR